MGALCMGIEIDLTITTERVRQIERIDEIEKRLEQIHRQEMLGPKTDIENFFKFFRRSRICLAA
jgi:hypothetical protein